MKRSPMRFFAKAPAATCHPGTPVSLSERPLEGTVRSVHRFRQWHGLRDLCSILIAGLSVSVLLAGLPSSAEEILTEIPELPRTPITDLPNPMGDTSPDSRLLSPSYRLSRVYRDLLELAVDDPAKGSSQVAGWQRVMIDFCLGYRLDGARFFDLEVARRESLRNSGRPGLSGVPEHSVRELREARELPGLDCLRKTQWAVVRQLEDRDPRALASLAGTHLGVYSRQIRPPEVFWLAPHSRDFVVDLAERHMVSTGERDLVVGLLVELANLQRQANNYEDGLESRALFERALELDPDHRVARYWAGFLSEKYGRYRKASHHFGRLVELEPDDQEARLRWAVVTLRLGGREAREAATALRQLARDTGGAVPTWMSRVAYGELARHLGTNDPRAAITLAREGLGRFPDESSLHLQVAYHLRLDAWEESLRSLGHAETRRPTEDALGARARYDLAREQGLAENSRWVEAEVVKGREPWREALDLLELQWRRLPDTRPEPIESCGFLIAREGVQ